MAEYFSPGVYVEEFEIGAKPIEGVSTSTAGFIGFAERGPLNIPALVTSFADYQRIFGGYLPEIAGGRSIGDARWLAYAVEAFFNNGGQRVYVTRVAELDATKPDYARCATGFLLDVTGNPAISVSAVNEGIWGNEIGIIVKPGSLFVANLTEEGGKDSTFIKVNSITGLKKGSVIQFLGGSATFIVNDILPSEKKIILKTPLTQLVPKDTRVSSVEFDLRIRRSDVDEFFNSLSLNPDHSRYIEKIVTDSSSYLIKIAVLSPSPDTVLMNTENNSLGWLQTKGTDGIPSTDIGTVVIGADDSEPSKRTGIYALKNINEISVVAIPGITTHAVQEKLIAHCESMKNRCAILDPEPGADIQGIQVQRNMYDSKYAALYYPWIQMYEPLSGSPINMPPSGAVAGMYARSDNERGVHKAPANEKINGALGLEKLAGGGSRIIAKGQQDILNPKGINCIRSFPGSGIRVWGARTLSGDPVWNYINVRRLFIFVEESIRENTRWVVFEPNNEKLWEKLKSTLTEFLTRVWRDGALVGTKPEQAFFVKCDRTTMTQDDIDHGRVICVIGIAPAKSAEFVTFRITQWQDGSVVTE